MFFFFFKQKTAYEMRISDWSSDVCSSDLTDRFSHQRDRAKELTRTAWSAPGFERERRSRPAVRATGAGRRTTPPARASGSRDRQRRPPRPRPDAAGGRAPTTATIRMRGRNERRRRNRSPKDGESIPPRPPPEPRPTAERRPRR